ncbi:hypothetical protein FPOA_06678 [Fusarium poae]|uniref:Uncharacterized protein n=1 Tax=Fusarium poae TaxID=36050 RepID=A0A1B8AIT8_FUSPO|nr:hypothetical protein FPOA_06678 [Fusarium poae]
MLRHGVGRTNPNSGQQDAFLDTTARNLAQWTVVSLSRTLITQADTTSSFFASEGTPDTSCDQIIQDAQCSITQVMPQVQPSPRRKGPKKRPREEEIPCNTISALTQGSSAALDGKEGNLRPNGASDTGTEQQDKIIAASIIKKLIDGIKAVRTEGNSPNHEKPHDTPQTVSIEVVKWTDSINQLGMNLWHHSDKVEQAATHIVHQDRLLSSYCRLYLKAVQEPLHYDQDLSKQETQRRHEDAVSLLSLVVNGLYEYRQSLALVLYNAVCKKRFLLSGSTKVSSARRSRIAKLVVDGLRYEPIAIAEDSTVLHPGVFLKYHKQSLQLPDICAALGLSNLKGLSLSDEEIGKYWSGVPIRLFARQDANKFITCYDEKHGLNLITDCAINGAGTVQPVSTQSPEDVSQNHHTQQYDGRHEEVGTNSAVDVQRNLDQTKQPSFSNQAPIQHATDCFCKSIPSPTSTKF